MAGPPRVALVETSEHLPGLLPFQAWDVLGTASRVMVRGATVHPAADHLHLAGLDLVEVEPATLERADLDLRRPGTPEDRRIAKALLQDALAGAEVVYLLGPQDDGVARALAGMAAEHDLEIELVLLAQQPAGTELLGLVEVLRRLRDPDDGCPWDLQQDHRSLVRYLLEECYELVEAIEEGDDQEVVEELGDVLLQVVFHAQVAADRGAFAIDDVARRITAKLVHRHPHVFGDGDATTPAEVQARWDELKAEEKDRDGPFDGVPAAAPALDLLQTLDRKAARAGLAPPDRPAPAARLAALATEVAATGDEAERERVLGELAATTAQLARSWDLDAEAAGRAAARRWRTRTTSALAELDGPARGQVDPDDWAAAWRRAGEDPPDSA